MNSVSWIVWGVAAVAVGVIVIPYYIRFRRRLARDAARKREASHLGLDKPAAQYPYIDAGRCIGCGACVDACPEGDVLGVVAGTAVVINGLRCVGHAHCETACPVGAIEVGLGDLKSRSDLPLLDDGFQTSVDGVYVVGELGGLALVRNAVRQGRVVVESFTDRPGSPRAATCDSYVEVAIVGAGPAGLSAALTARRHGLSHAVFEREDGLGGSLLHYPRKKMVLTQPVELPPWGRLDRDEYHKETLLEIFQEIVGSHGLDLRFGSTVQSVVRDGKAFQVETNRGTIRARRVVLAQGRRGLPRKLGVPGEGRSKVMYRLLDAASYHEQRVLVVGGGDSAVEAALGLARQPSNRVTLSYRRDRLVRIKKRNHDAFARAIEDRRLEALFESRVEEIGDDNVDLRLADGNVRSLGNDSVFVFAGGVPPLDLLHKIGARFGGTD